MTTIHEKLDRITFFALVFIAVLLTGCASSQEKLEAYQKVRGQTGFIYAQVNSVHPGITNKETCDKNLGGDKYKETRERICGRLEELNVIYVSLVVNKEVIASNEIVPVNLEIKRGAIIKMDMEKQAPFRFVEVAAFQPTENCRWIGYDNFLNDDAQTTIGKVIAGFMGGMLLLPAAVHFSSDRQGGVECNGWSYKTAFEDFLRRY